jgi:DNA-binding SARP family transcriptional activator
MLQTQPIRPRLAIYAFGALRLVRDGEPVTEEAWHTRQARQLLKVLLTERPRPVAADRLVELLWPNSPPVAAATTLRSAVNALRNVLEPNRPRRGHARYIVTMAPGYAFLPHPDIWLDVAAFEKELETARHIEDPSARVQRLQTAVALYQDDYLAGDPYADWAQGERERLRELYIAAQLELAAWRAAAGDLNAAMAACRQVVARDPVRETVYQALMRYQAAAGDSAGALLTYERCRAILTEELGADPSPLTQQIHQHILNGEIEALPNVGNRPFAAPPSSAAAEPPPQRTLLPMSEEGPLEPLVGREQETATLRAALADALQGRGCVVVLEGEAGVGKTRLVYPPLRQAIAEAATVLGGACRPLEQPLPFAPLADLVGRYVAALPASMLPALPRASLAPLAQIAPSLQDRLPDLALPVAEGLLRGEEYRLRIIEGLVSFLVWLAAVRPLVLFLDDLHWADRDTLAVLGRLAQRCEDRALLLLLVYRTDDLAENDDLARLLHELRRQPRTVTVPVRRLTPANVQELVRHYAAGAPQADELAAALYRVTEGNPLFVTEALRDVRERLAAYTAPPVGPGWGAVPTLYFNGRVHEVILERIERLPATAQGLLHLAAAFQRDFSLDLLEATAERDPMEPLQVLMQRRFLVDRADDRLDFSHAVVRQVAYERINALERRRLHARIAGALGRRADAEQSARELAFHLQQAGAGHQADFAKFSVIAGEQLLRGFGFRQAVDQFEAALAALERMSGAPPDLIRRAYQGLGLAYEGLTDPDGVAAAYRRLHAWAAAQGDRDLMLTTHSRVTSVMTLLGRQRESNDLLAELHVELSRHGVVDGGSSVIRDLVARRHLIYSPDDPEDTPDWGAYTPPPPAVPEPRADLLRLLDPAYAVLPLYDYGYTLLAQGQLREGTACLVDAADLALATAQPSLAANAFHQLAMAARVVGDPAQSGRYAAQSQAATRQVPDASSDIANLWPEITGALLDIHQGRVDAAEARLRQVMAALAMRPAFQNYRNAAAIGLAAVGVARGHLAGTVEAVEAALNDPGNQFPFTYVRGVLLLARVAAKQGRDDASAAYLRRCLRYAGQRSLLDEYVQAVLALMDLRPSGAPVAALTESVLAYIRRMAITAAEQHVQTALDRYLAQAGR